MASATEENYLKALLKLSKDNGKCTVSEISKLLGVSTPTTNSMIRKLSDKNWIKYEKYKPLELTALGRKKAALVIRKHRLTEMFLVEAMNFGWEEVHSIAEQIEHIDSEPFFNRMDELLGQPSMDPHGSPIPDVNGVIQHKTYMKLASGENGKQYRVTSLGQSSKEFLRFLNRREIKLGLTLEILSVESFDGSLVVRYEGHEKETLSKTVCEKLLVEIV